MDKEKYVVSEGSGFFVKSDGTFVTNAHVVEDAWYGRIDQDNYVYDIEISSVIKYSEPYDFAILKINNTYNISYPTFTLADDYDIGDTVYSIGYPQGSLTSVISKGVISGDRIEGSIEYILSTASIDHGSSGGVSVNAQGEVLGITSVIFGDGYFGSIPNKYFENFIPSNSNSFTKSLLDYFHPSTTVFLTSANFEWYFDVSVVRTSAYFSSSTSGWVGYSVQVTPKKDYDLSEYAIALFATVKIQTNYTYKYDIGSYTYTSNSSEVSYCYLTLYELYGLSDSTTTSEFISVFYNQFLYSIDGFSFDITSASGTIIVYDTPPL